MQEFFIKYDSRTHESEHLYRGRYAERGIDDAGKIYPTAEHPIVRTHPKSGTSGIIC